MTSAQPPRPVQAGELERDFGLTVRTLAPHVGGFESDCWVADDAWFVKVWKQSAPPDGLGLLQELRALGLPVVAAVPAITGKLYASLGHRPYAVFPYIPGRTASPDDWQITARALKQVHEFGDQLDLPRATLEQPDVAQLAQRLDHPWIAGRRDEVAAAILRLDEVIARAKDKPVREVLCHRDFGGLNLILGDDGQVTAILDWDQAVIGPREHDVWIAAEGPQLEPFLAEYDAHDLDLDHLEYALLSRALRDMAARVLSEVDRPGVDTWGFDRIARLDSDLRVFRGYCN